MTHLPQTKSQKTTMVSSTAIVFALAAILSALLMPLSSFGGISSGADIGIASMTVGLAAALGFLLINRLALSQSP